MAQISFLCRGLFSFERPLLVATLVRVVVVYLTWFGRWFLVIDDHHELSSIRQYSSICMATAKRKLEVLDDLHGATFIVLREHVATSWHATSTSGQLLPALLTTQ